MKNKKRIFQIIAVTFVICLGLISNYHSVVSDTVKTYTFTTLQKTDSTATSSGKTEFFIYTKKMIESGISHLISNF